MFNPTLQVYIILFNYVTFPFMLVVLATIRKGVSSGKDPMWTSTVDYQVYVNYSGVICFCLKN